jgi:hypothetical protein
METFGGKLRDLLRRHIWINSLNLILKATDGRDVIELAHARRSRGDPLGRRSMERRT